MYRLCFILHSFPSPLMILFWMLESSFSAHLFFFLISIHVNLLSSISSNLLQSPSKNAQPTFFLGHQGCFILHYKPISSIVIVSSILVASIYGHLIFLGFKNLKSTIFILDFLKILDLSSSPLLAGFFWSLAYLVFV